jgi:outer membrane protein TolC
MARTGWRRGLWVVLLPAALAGCGRHCFLCEGDYKECVAAPLPHGLADPADCADVPPASCVAVSTVLNPERDRRAITLCECIAIALEKGRVGGTNIRVLAFNPALAQTEVEQSLAQFDTRFRTSMLWETTDERAGGSPLQSPASLLATIANGVNDLQDFTSQRALFQTQLLKPLATGGTAGITFQTDYELNNLGNLQQFNPSYRPRLIFTVEQPLLRGAGVEVNQTGILIARLAQDQTHTAFAGGVNDLLFSVEQAYWALYAAYWGLYTQDVALRQAHDAWQQTKTLFDRNQARIQDLALMEGNYEAFRLGRVDAVQAVLEAERQLRLVVGLPPEDGCRLVPADQPTSAPVRPDWCASLAEALQNRPELIAARREITRLNVEIKAAKNATLPDLRVVGSYDINGLGSRLDGPDANFNALRNMASDHFNNWSVGLSLDQPIGARAANAAMRRAFLRMEQQQAQLRDQEQQAAFALQRSYRDLLARYERVKLVSSVRRAATTQYQALYEEFRRNAATLQFLLSAQQAWLAAMRDEQAAIFAYNIALADFKREKGTIMRFDNVSVAEGPLPGCVCARASEHIRERQAALKVRERAVPVAGADGGCGDGPASLEALVTNGPPSVPALMEKAATLPTPGDLPTGASAPTPAPKPADKETPAPNPKR